MDLRLQHMPFEFGGKQYILTCNMSVLADVQEAFGGNLMAALWRPNSLRAALTFLAAMLNDYAEDQGWDEHWTAKQVGKCLSADPKTVQILTNQIGRFVRRSITQTEPQGGTEQEETSKNGLTRQSR